MLPELEPAYRGRRVCVTGGAGFIGSHLVSALVELGADVLVIDDLSTGRRRNLPEPARQRLVAGSILEPAALAKAVAGAQVIFHLAALTSVAESVQRPEEYLQVNDTGTLRVLEAARAAAAPDHRVVYAASSSVYGDRGEVALVESLAPKPASPYAASKCAGEQILSAYAVCHGLSCISLRYFNIFGPRQQPDSPYAAVIPRFAEALLAGRRLTVYGDGTQTRDFTHVADAVRANLLAGVSERALRGESINIACGRRSDLLTLIRLMGKILGVEPAYVLAPPRAGEVKHSLADITAAGELLGYRPLIGLEEGLKETLADFAGESS